jgi:hypothetical protein
LSERVAARRLLWDRRPVLGAMRDRSGGPNLRIRLLALVLALLLAGPLVLLLLSAARRVLGLAL